MPTIHFVGEALGTLSVEADVNSKLLLAANRAKTGLRFGCAAARCGTCTVKVSGGALTPMTAGERLILEKLSLPLDGSIRLACQARVLSGEITVDIDYQDTVVIPEES